MRVCYYFIRKSFRFEIFAYFCIIKKPLGRAVAPAPPSKLLLNYHDFDSNKKHLENIFKV